MAESRCASLYRFARVAESVDAGRGRSTGETSSSSSRGLPALVSEHTANWLRGMTESFAQSRRDCDSSDMDGVRKRTTPPKPATRSAMRSAVKVLPEPQAMISFPRLRSANPETVSLSATRWYSRKTFFDFRLSALGHTRLKFRQFIDEPSNTSGPQRTTGLSSRFRRAFSAFLPHLEVVETNTPPTNSVVE